MNKNYETIEKPWGREEIIEINKRYMFKRLTMYEGHRCSLQYHNYKLETIYILEGKLRIYFGEDQNSLENNIFEAGESITLSPKVVHRMEAVSDCIYLESSTPEINDVVRLADDYIRDA